MSNTYPLDRFASLASNRITNEVHTLHPVEDGQFNFIVPNVGPFYGEGIILEYFTGDIPATEEELRSLSTTRLIKGVDYTLTHRADLPKSITELPAYGSISFIDIKMKGHVKLTYRTVGSTLVMNEQQVAGMLVEKTVDPRSVNWNDVVIDIVFPPSAHLDEAEELYGMEALIQSMRNIEIALLGGTSNEHFHEITQINGLVNVLSRLVTNQGANKLNVGPYLHLLTHEGAFEIVLPDFNSDVHLNVKIGLVGPEGHSKINIHASLPSITPINGVVGDTIAYFEDDYLSSQARGHLVYRHEDGRFRMAIDIGTLTNVVVFIAGVAMNTTNPRVYTDDWGLNDSPSDIPQPVRKDLNVQTGGGLQLDFDKTGLIKANTAWMVLTHEGTFTRTLPVDAPDNAVILVKDHGDKANENRATIMGNITYANTKKATGLYLDKQRGWIKFQFKKHKGDGIPTETDNSWHVVSGA